jgi:hypothetical protein
MFFKHTLFLGPGLWYFHWPGFEPPRQPGSFAKIAHRAIF